MEDPTSVSVLRDVLPPRPSMGPRPCLLADRRGDGVGNMAATEALALGLADHRGLLWRNELSDPKCPGCIFSVLFCLCRVQFTFSGRIVSPTQGIVYAFVCIEKQLACPDQ